MRDERWRDLREIMHRDPDAFPTEPTAADYARHKAWAIATYGQDLWDTYQRGGWDLPEV